MCPDPARGRTRHVRIRADSYTHPLWRSARGSSCAVVRNPMGRPSRLAWIVATLSREITLSCSSPLAGPTGTSLVSRTLVGNIEVAGHPVDKWVQVVGSTRLVEDRRVLHCGLASHLAFQCGTDQRSTASGPAPGHSLVEERDHLVGQPEAICVLMEPNTSAASRNGMVHRPRSWLPLAGLTDQGIAAIGQDAVRAVRSSTARLDRWSEASTALPRRALLVGAGRAPPTVGTSPPTGSRPGRSGPVRRGCRRAPGCPPAGNLALRH